MQMWSKGSNSYNFDPDILHCSKCYRSLGRDYEGNKDVYISGGFKYCKKCYENGKVSKAKYDEFLEDVDRIILQTIDKKKTVTLEELKNPSGPQSSLPSYAFYNNRKSNFSLSAKMKELVSKKYVILDFDIYYLSNEGRTYLKMLNLLRDVYTITNQGAYSEYKEDTKSLILEKIKINEGATFQQLLDSLRTQKKNYNWHHRHCEGNLYGNGKDPDFLKDLLDKLIKDRYIYIDSTIYRRGVSIILCK